MLRSSEWLASGFRVQRWTDTFGQDEMVAAKRSDDARWGVVTGGAGFIGSTLVDRLLASGWDVLAVDDLSTGRTDNLLDASRSPAFRLEVIDILAPELARLFEVYSPSVVFHLAAQPSVAVSVREPATDSEINVVGSLRVFDGARRSGVRKVVFAASGGTLYGDVDAAELPIDESTPHRPRSPYGLQKRRSSTISRSTRTSSASTTPRSRSPTSTDPAKIHTAKQEWSPSSPTNCDRARRAESRVTENRLGILCLWTMSRGVRTCCGQGKHARREHRYRSAGVDQPAACRSRGRNGRSDRISAGARSTE